MRPIRLLVVVLSLASCKKEPAKPAKLRKMDFKVMVDERGRMLPEIQLFDDKHEPYVLVGGSYTLTLARPDDTILCSVTRTLAKEDYVNKHLKGDWQDASCPPDPAADELRVTLEVKTGDASDAPPLARTKPTPTKYIYRHLAAKQPAAVDPTKLPAEAPLPEPPPGDDAGSAAGSADAKPTGTGSAKAATGTKPGGAKPSTDPLVHNRMPDDDVVDRPVTDDKPAADKPATTK